MNGNGLSETQGEIIREELATLRDQLVQTEAIFFMDIPLAFEQDYASWFNETWIWSMWIEISKVERLMKRDHLSKDESESRPSSPLARQKKRFG